MTAVIIILATLVLLPVYGCCVAAGEADRRMEELERRRKEARDNVHPGD